MPEHSPADDPPPTPPRKPEAFECCGSGCMPCIFDLYEEDLQRFESALHAWEKRQRAERGR
jgi:hypothetical protein